MHLKMQDLYGIELIHHPSQRGSLKKIQKLPSAFSLFK